MIVHTTGVVVADHRYAHSAATISLHGRLAVLRPPHTAFLPLITSYPRVHGNCEKTAATRRRGERREARGERREARGESRVTRRESQNSVMWYHTRPKTWSCSTQARPAEPRTWKQGQGRAVGGQGNGMCGTAVVRSRKCSGKGSGWSMKDGRKAVRGQGKAVEKVKERQRHNAVSIRGKALKRQWKGKERDRGLAQVFQQPFALCRGSERQCFREQERH